MMTRDDILIRRFPVTRRAVLAGVLLGALSVTAPPLAGHSIAARPHVRATITIGTKNFGEEYLVSDMYKLLLAKHGFRVNIRNLAETPILQNALRHGDIDLYPEYTGTGLEVVLNRAGTVHNARQAFQLVQKGYRKFGLTWLRQSYLNDTNGVGVTFATAQKYGLHNLSDLARVSNKLSFAALPDCENRADCLVGLKSRYGMNFNKITYLGAQPVIYKGLVNGQFDAIEVFTTDGAVQGLHVDVLTDNKGVFPADHIAPVVRDSILKKYPSIRPILDNLARFITTKAQKKLNFQVDILGKPHLAVARAFLKSKNLI